MTKMYVLAKCVFIALGLYVINIILRYLALPLIHAADGKGPVTATILSCGYALMFLTLYLTVSRSRDSVRRLSGPSRPDERLIEMPVFANALRITLVLSGLMLLPGVLDYFVYLAKLPAMSRALLFAAFGSERFSNQLPRDGWALAQVLNPLMRLCLSAYLIIGAPAYVNWQARKEFSKKRK